jgi:hypothetical protein
MFVDNTMNRRSLTRRRTEVAMCSCHEVDARKGTTGVLQGSRLVAAFERVDGAAIAPNAA